MRISGLFFVAVIAACGSSSTTPATVDATPTQIIDAPAAPPADSARADAHPVTPYNMPGMVFCYGTLTCSTTSAMPVCCDSAGSDGGFVDNCVADVPTCAGMASANAYQCGQAADCGAGQVCCGSFGMSSSGNPFFMGTTCAASCPAGDMQLCVAATECLTSGTGCVGKDISGRDVGLCQ